MIKTINWIPVVLRDATEEEREMYECDKIADNPVPEDDEVVLLTLVNKDSNGNHIVVTDMFIEDWGSFDYYDWEEIIAWAHFPKAYEDGEEVLR